ncbi:hypothetical protein [Streptomyces sp. NPDC006527]|uniref:hypothetical protein n=1 Tax=Streptomyces sp. NPDC006527 TaxID=3364749 RepID=UPI0036A7C5AF
MLVCALLGAAVMVMAAVHHFHDRSTSGAGLVSDGLLHTTEPLGAGGTYRRRRAPTRSRLRLAATAVRGR